MTYRFCFEVDERTQKAIEKIAAQICMPIKFEPVFNGVKEKFLVIYADHVMIKEPVYSNKSIIPDCQVILDIKNGIDRPLVKVETNMTADLILASKNAKTEIVTEGYVKMHAGKQEEETLGESLRHS
jgi:hypothetical protein